MNDKIVIPEDVIEFHGHMCPGLALGYRAALIGLREFPRPVDEGVAVIVENKSCSVDAIQYLMGATFGKGNLIFQDYGKQVFTFISPKKSVRVALNPGIMGPHRGSMEEMIERILSMPEEELFKVEYLDLEKPPQASIHPSKICSKCGEPVMEPRARLKDGKIVCIPCSED